MMGYNVYTSDSTGKDLVFSHVVWTREEVLKEFPITDYRLKIAVRDQSPVLINDQYYIFKSRLDLDVSRNHK